MQKILHVLLEPEESKPFHGGEALRIDTHGVQHVVLQIARTRRAGRPEIENGHSEEATPLLEGPTVTKQKRFYRHAPKRECQYCHQMMSGAGLWKHELYCKDRPGNDQKRITAKSERQKAWRAKEREQRNAKVVPQSALTPKSAKSVLPQQRQVKCKYCPRVVGINNIARHEAVCKRDKGL